MKGIESFIATVADNFENSRFKFVILMDKVESRLKDLIFFINTNSKFDVYGVELEYYKVEDNEILIPRIWGEEVRKEVGASASTSARKKWDKENFFGELQQSAPNAYENTRKLFDFAEKEGLKIDFGTGTKNGTFTPKIDTKNRKSLSLCMVSTKGSVDILSWDWNMYVESDDKYREFLSSINDKITKEQINSIDEDVPKYDLGMLEPDDMQQLFSEYSKIIAWAKKTDMTDNPDYK